MSKKQLQPKVYRAKQIAQIACIDISTVWNYAKQKKLTPIHITPRVTVFDADEVHRFFGIKSQSQEVAQ